MNQIALFYVPQKLVANVPSELEHKFRVTNQVYKAQKAFELSKPSVMKDFQGRTVASTTAKVNRPDNPSDNSMIPESADEIATKMKNQLAIKEVLGNGHYGVTLNCKQLNQVCSRS